MLKQLFKKPWQGIALIVAVIIGISLLIIPEKNAAKEDNDNKEDITFYSEQLEEKIKNLILQVDGIEKVSVLITLENTGKSVYAEDTSTNSAEYVIINSGEEEGGIKLTEIYPEVRGVAVVCTNGNDSKTKEKITSLLSSALGIPTNKITVVG